MKHIEETFKKLSLVEIDYKDKYIALLEEKASGFNLTELKERLSGMAHMQSAGMELLLSLADHSKSIEILQKYGLEDIFGGKDKSGKKGPRVIGDDDDASDKNFKNGDEQN